MVFSKKFMTLLIVSCFFISMQTVQHMQATKKAEVLNEPVTPPGSPVSRKKPFKIFGNKSAGVLQAPSLEGFKPSEKQEFLWKKVVEKIKQLKKRDPQEAKQVLQRLQKLSGVKTSERVGLGIFIDHGGENPKYEKLGAVTTSFIHFLNKKEISGLVSASVFYNFLCRKVYGESPKKFNIPEDKHEKWKKVNKFARDGSFLNGDWRLIDCPGTQFVFFIPRGEEKIKRYINIEEKNNKIIDDSNNYNDLISFLKYKTKPKIEDISQFRKIFKDKKELEKDGVTASLVIYLIGHGSIGSKIANIAPSVMQNLLDFFKGKAWFLFIATCYGGGQNVKFMVFWDKNNKIFRALPYTLVIQGLKDSVTYLSYDPALLLMSVINEKTIEEGLRKVEGLFMGEELHAGQENVPQVLFPFGMRFVPLIISDFIMGIGEVLLLIHKLEEKPITLWTLKEEKELSWQDRYWGYKAEGKKTFKDTLMLLVSPEQVDVLIKVRPFNIARLTEEKTFGTSFHQNYKAYFQRDKAEQWKNFPAAYELIRLSYKHEKAWLEGVWKEYFSGDDYEVFLQGYKLYGNVLFPAFLPMTKSGRAKEGVLVEQSFSEIEVYREFYNKGKKYLLPFVGVLTFIRDAFFDLNESQKSLNIFKIGRLKGPDDISPLLAMLRHKKKDPNESDLEKVLKKEREPKKRTIILTDVFVEAGYDRKTEKMVRRVRFKLGDKYWKTSGQEWDFVEDTLKGEIPLKELLKEELKVRSQEIDLPVEQIKKTRELMQSSDRWGQDKAVENWKKFFAKGVSPITAITSDKEVEFWLERIKDGKDLDVVEKILKKIKKSDDKSLISIWLNRAFFTELFKTKKGFDVAIILAERGMTAEDKNVQKEALGLFIELVKEGKAYPQALQAAEKGVDSEDREVQKNAFSLLAQLVAKEQAYDKAIQVVEKGMSIENEGVQEEAFNLFSFLLERVYIQARNAAEKGIEVEDKDVQSRALRLFAKLVEKGKAYTSAAQAAQKGMMVENKKVQFQALVVFEWLVSKGQAYGKAEQAAEKGIKSENKGVQIRALRVFMWLVGKGQVYERALQVAEKFMEFKDEKIQMEVLRVFSVLVNKGQAYDNAAQAAENGMAVEDKRIRLKSLGIFAKLVEKDLAYEKAAQAAENGMAVEDKEIRLKSLEIFEKLVEKERAYKKAAQIVRLFLKSDSDQLRKKAQGIWDKLPLKTKIKFHIAHLLPEKKLVVDESELETVFKSKPIVKKEEEVELKIKPIVIINEAELKAKKENERQIFMEKNEQFKNDFESVKRGVMSQNEQEREEAIKLLGISFDNFKKYGQVAEGVVSQEELNNNIKFELVIRLAKDCVDSSTFQPVHEKAFLIAQELTNMFKTKKSEIQLATFSLLEMLVKKGKMYPHIKKIMKAGEKSNFEKVRNKAFKMSGGYSIFRSLLRRRTGK